MFYVKTCKFFSEKLSQAGQIVENLIIQTDLTLLNIKKTA